METITVLFLLLAASYILSNMARTARLPRVMGPIAVGLICGTFFKQEFMDLSILKSFADLGLVFLIFYVGLELDIVNCLKRPGRYVFLSVFDMLVPFGVTFIVLKLIGFETFAALIIGVIMAISAEAVSVDILRELNILRSRIGETIILTATIDDVLGLLFLSGLVTYVEKGDQSLIFVVFNILIFFTLIYVVRFLIMPYILKFSTDSKSQLFIVGTLMVLLVSIVAEALGFGELLGALLAGVVIRYTYLKDRQVNSQKEITEMFEAVTFGFLAPFFFIWVGINADIGLVVNAPMLGLLLTGLAILTKLLSSLIGHFFLKGSFREGIIIGVAMINKGVVELVLAEKAREAGLIGPDVFAAIVFMALVTTIISPITFNLLLKRTNLS